MISKSRGSNEKDNTKCDDKWPMHISSKIDVHLLKYLFWSNYLGRIIIFFINTVIERNHFQKSPTSTLKCVCVIMEFFNIQKSQINQVKFKKNDY